MVAPISGPAPTIESCFEQIKNIKGKKTIASCLLALDGMHVDRDKGFALLGKVLETNKADNDAKTIAQALKQSPTFSMATKGLRKAILSVLGEEVHVGKELWTMISNYLRYGNDVEQARLFETAIHKLNTTNPANEKPVKDLFFKETKTLLGSRSSREPFFTALFEALKSSKTPAPLPKAAATPSPAHKEPMPGAFPSPAQVATPALVQQPSTPSEIATVATPSSTPAQPGTVNPLSMIKEQKDKKAFTAAFFENALAKFPNDQGLQEIKHLTPVQLEGNQKFIQAIEDYSLLQLEAAPKNAVFMERKDETLAETAIRKRQWIAENKDKITIVSGNDLFYFPPELYSLPNLKELSLTGGCIACLPDEIGWLTNLTTLDLSVNWLTEIPGTVKNLTRLQIFNISKNYLQTMPSLKDLASLKELKILDGYVERRDTWTDWARSWVQPLEQVIRSKYEVAEQAKIS